MQLLSQHVRRDEREAAIRYSQAAFAVGVVIFANYGVVFDFGTAIDNAAANAAMLSNLDLR